MSKLIMILFAAAACVQIIKPIGWPGLRYRRDAWKLAVAGFLAVVVVASIRPEPEPGTADSVPGTGTPQTGETSQ